MLSAATLVTVTISGEAKGVITKDDVLAGVIQELGDIPLTVVASSIDAGSIIYNVVSFQWFHFAYRAVLTVSTPPDYFDSADDVAAAVRDAFGDVAGSTPTGVQAVYERGLPAILAPAGASLLPDIASTLNADIMGTLLLVVGLIALLVVALGWGKNVGALSRLAV